MCVCVLWGSLEVSWGNDWSAITALRQSYRNETKYGHAYVGHTATSRRFLLASLRKEEGGRGSFSTTVGLDAAQGGLDG